MSPKQIKRYLLLAGSCLFFFLLRAQAQSITSSQATGTISACAGMASASPNLQQITVSGSNLTGNISVSAPANFEISTSPNSGFGSSLTLIPQAGTVNNTIIYVQSTATAAAGAISGNVSITSIGSVSQDIPVNGTVNALPTVNAPGPQSLNAGAATSAINFTGTGNTFTWTNDTPGIGLPASGTGNIASFTATNTGGTPLTATITVTPQQAGLAYIANDAEVDNNILAPETVSVINTITNKVVSTITVGAAPLGASVSPDGSEVFIANDDSNTVSVISTSTNTVIATIPVGINPRGITVSPDGNTVYVANINSNNVSVISTANNKVVNTVTVGTTQYAGPSDVLVSPDGKILYVTYGGGTPEVGYVLAISTSSLAVLSKVTVTAGNVGQMVLSPDGNTLYFVDNNNIDVLNTSTQTITGSFPAGTGPSGLAITPGGDYLYVSNSSNQVLAISTATESIMATIPVGNNPGALALTSNGSELYVQNIFSNNVSVINTATNQVVATVPVGSGPEGFGNFISPGIGCVGVPVKFTITVNPASTGLPTINSGQVTGAISACAGTASASPNLQQITVSGSNLTGSISLAAPTNFAISTSPNSGFGSTLTLAPQSGTVNSTIIYVQSTATAATGNISGNVSITSPGAVSQQIPVTGTVYSLPTVSAPGNRSLKSGTPTTAVNFSGTGNIFNWTNDTPAIGLAAAGTGTIPSFIASNSGTTPVIATIAVTPQNTDVLYVANFGANTVSAINASTNAIISTINVGSEPTSCILSPDGSKLYVACNISVSVISTATNQVIYTLQAPINPDGLAISPDGSTLYISDFGGSAVDFYDTSTFARRAIVYVGANPGRMCLSPDGATLYVVNYSSGSVSVINTATASPQSNISVGTNPDGLALSPNGNLLYVTNQSTNNVSVINTSTDAVVATIPVGTSPGSCAVSADGTVVYVANKSDGTISVINASTNTVTNTIPAFSNPAGLLLSPAASELFVSNQAGNNISVVNTATSAIIATYPVGQQPFGLAYLSKGNCPGLPVKFTITVNPAATSAPAITTGVVTGDISACVGTAAESPSIQQFTVSATSLKGNVSAVAPPGFEISLNAATGYIGSLSIANTGGTISKTTIYVRSSSSASPGSISGSVVLSSPGTANVDVPVSGVVNFLPAISPVSNQIFVNGTRTTGVVFNTDGYTVNWLNDTPGIGLASSGTGNIAPFTAVNTGTTNIVATITATPVPTGFAYVACYKSNTVNVVNTATNAVVATIPVGENPFAVAVSPNNNLVYVANTDSNSISVIDCTSNKVIAVIPVGTNPFSITISPDGSRAYITYGEEDAIVTVINTLNNTVIRNVTVSSGNYGAAISPDGSLLYVVNNVSSNVLVINTTSFATVATIPLSNIGYCAVMSPNGNALYVTNYLSGDVTVISTSTNKVVATIRVGSSPDGIAISADGTKVYAANFKSGNVSVINTATNTVTATIPVGNNPFAVSLNGDGSLLYVTNNGSNSVSVISTSTNAVLSTLPVGDIPESLGNFVSAGTGCAGSPATFTITVTPSPPLTITASANLSSLSTIYGTPSASESFQVSGSGLTAGVLVTPPPGFEVSTNNDTFSSTVTAGSGGDNSAITVYIRLAAVTPVDSYSGPIVLTCPGAPTVTVSMPESTVTPALLTIIADNKSKTYGSPNPVLTASYIGFVNFDTAAQLTTQPELSTSATAASPVGQYPIMVGGALSPNYTIAYLSGVLTILPTEASLVIPNTFTPNGDGINDTWDIKFLGDYINCSVDVFTRWGQKIYSSVGYSVPWNGTYNGSALPTGTYYYIINLKNGLTPLSGFVAIVR